MVLKVIIEGDYLVKYICIKDIDVREDYEDNGEVYKKDKKDCIYEEDYIYEKGYMYKKEDNKFKAYRRLMPLKVYREKFCDFLESVRQNGSNIPVQSGGKELLYASDLPQQNMHQGQPEHQTQNIQVPQTEIIIQQQQVPQTQPQQRLTFYVCGIMLFCISVVFLFFVD